MLYFAALRELLAVEEEEVELAAGADVAALLALLAARGGAWERLRDADVARAAVNQEFAELDAKLGDGDEVALFPPVTGG